MKLKPPSPKQFMGNFSLATNAPNWWRILVCRFARWSIGCTYISRAFLLLFCVTVSFTQPANNCLRFRSPPPSGPVVLCACVVRLREENFSSIFYPTGRSGSFPCPPETRCASPWVSFKGWRQSRGEKPSSSVCVFFVCILLRFLYLERNQAQHTDLPRSCKLMLGFVLFFLCSLFPCWLLCIFYSTIFAYWWLNLGEFKNNKTGHTLKTFRA